MVKLVKPQPLPDKRTVFIEIFGPRKYGKTTFAINYGVHDRTKDKVAVIHTEPKDRSQTLKDFEGQILYYPCNDWEDIDGATLDACSRPDVVTVVYDSSADIDNMCAEYLKDKEGVALVSKDPKTGRVIPIGWRHVYERIRSKIINMVLGSNKNLIFTAKVKDEWKDGEPTGFLTRDGIKDSLVDYQSHIKIELIKGLPDPADKTGLLTTLREYVFGKVHYNGFTTEGHCKQYLVDISERGVLDELVEPQNGPYKHLYKPVEIEPNVFKQWWIGSAEDIVKQGKIKHNVK